MRGWCALAVGGALLASAAPARAQFNPFNPFNPGATNNPGGTAAPNSGQANRNPGATEQQLRSSEQSDSGRGLEWFYLHAGGGVEYLNPTAFSHTGDLLIGKSTSGAAPSASVDLGARLLTLTIGLRGRVDILSDYKLLNVGPEIGLHLPSGDLEPYFLLGGGYSRMLGVSSEASPKSIGGFHLRLAGGLDYYLTNFFTIGALVNVDMVHLGRDAFGVTTSSTSLDQNGAPVTIRTTTTYDAASALGIAVGGGVMLGLHL